MLTGRCESIRSGGWKSDPGHEGHWRAKDSILEYDGKSTAKDKDLWTEKDYGDFVLVADWRLPGEPKPLVLSSSTTADPLNICPSSSAHSASSGSSISMHRPTTLFMSPGNGG